jgi:phosphatidylglycerol:prolipoprotein diacylglycerol transferase
MQQVLIRIPTDSDWFLPIVALLSVGAGAVVWALFTRQKVALPFFMLVVGFLGYQGGKYLADQNKEGIPIYGYGLMLFLAFVACTWLASRLARREGIAPEHVQDLAIYLFVGGVVGSRVWFFVEEALAGRPQDWHHFLYIWEGGLVFYGGVMGGAIAYLVAYYTFLKKNHVSTLKLADVIAPCAALGLCLGRIGCLLNGCCYGDVACANCPVVPVHFPLSGMPRQQLVDEGYQTQAGFTLDEQARNDHTVGAVEPGSAAAAAGLQAGDVITHLDGAPITDFEDLWRAFAAWPRDKRGKNDLTLTVQRGDKEPQEVTMTFYPKTIGLHPTQAYESISTLLILFFLLAYYPYRRHDGELLALFFMLYSVHRFLNEMLRADNKPVWGGMTLSQNGSLVVFAVGLVLFLWLRRLPAQYHPVKQPLPA